MAEYAPPEWSALGRNAFGIFLEVIKGGLVVASLSLPRTDGRSFVVAGRMETACDLVLAHPSISRVHAALQFDEQGALFLYDLRSTHGCFVNKKRVLAEEFVRLHIGDVVVFGESTRLYAVCGPPELLPAEYESLNLAKFRERLAKKREVQAEKRQEEQRGASWGFGEDAKEEDDPSEEEEDTAKAKEDLPDYLRNVRRL
jgi:pSer/pThr/pTyr-binding forkhead associated (FHA) protein